MCALKDLKDGTYTINDLEIMHQIIELRNHMRPQAGPAVPTIQNVNPNIY